MTTDDEAAMHVGEAMSDVEYRIQSLTSAIRGQIDDAFKETLNTFRAINKLAPGNIAQVCEGQDQSVAGGPETPLEFIQRAAHRGLEAELLDNADTLRVTGDVAGFLSACNRALGKFDAGLRHLDPAGATSLASGYGRLGALNPSL